MIAHNLGNTDVKVAPSYVLTNIASKDQIRTSFEKQKTNTTIYYIYLQLLFPTFCL